MTARVGMEYLIEYLRGLVQAGTADYYVAGVPFWQDDQLQDRLDRHRTDIYRDELMPIETYEGGTLVYKTYRSRFRNLEGGTVHFTMQDAAGNPVTGGSVDFAMGIVTFADNQAGSARFINARSYNLNAAAADVWRAKAGHFSGGVVRWRTDGHEVVRGNMASEATAMAMHFESVGGAQTVEIVAC